jgi:hypothetical protein
MTEQGPEDETRSFEYLSDEPDTARSPAEPPVAGRAGRGRKALIGVSVGALVLAGAAGAFAVAQLMSGGPRAASAAPADAMAFLSVDLDPSGGQKLAAYRTLKKFPALDEHLGLTSRDDLREWVFEGLTSDSGCKNLDFSDVEPWLGDALGVGAVPGKDEPTVFFTLEVTDKDAAAQGVRELAACLGGDEGAAGTAFAGDFMIVAETAAKARDLAASAEESALADDPTYVARTGEAGEDGIVTGYLAPSFGDYMSEQLTNTGGMFSDSSSGGSEALLAGRAGALTEDTPTPGTAPSEPAQPSSTELPEGFPSDFPTDMPSDFPTDFPTDFPSDFPDGGELGGGFVGPMSPFGMGPGFLLGGLAGSGGLEQLGEQLADFGGAAMQVRFADESLEVELSSHGLDVNKAPDGSVSLGDLPRGTGLALGLATGEAWAEQTVASLRKASPAEFDKEMAAASEETGLSLPEDLSTLAGDSVVVAFDSGVDFPALFSSFFFGPDPKEPVKVGLRITGDPGEIAPLAQKLADHASTSDGPQVVVGQGDDAVALGFDQDYVDELADGGDLAGSGSFKQALPDDGDSVGALFADFDAGGWLDKALEGSSKDDRANAEPLSAAGATMTRDGDTLHAVFRLTTD